jgi:erythrin-vacuolar iron transport family protein
MKKFYERVVLVELAVIAWIRNRFMNTPLFSAAFQVVFGDFQVFTPSGTSGR